MREKPDMGSFSGIATEMVKLVCSTTKPNSTVVHVISMFQEAMHIVTHSKACHDDVCVLCVCASTECQPGCKQWSIYSVLIMFCFFLCCRLKMLCTDSAERTVCD